VGNLLAGSILFLKPDTKYEVQLTLRDPDGGEAVQSAVVRTRAVPRAPTPKRTLHLYPPDHTGDEMEPVFTAAQIAFDALGPGDLLLVHPGVYRGGIALKTSGTADEPIVIRGDGDAILHVDGTDGFNLDLSGRDHVFVEDLAIRGGRIGIMARGASELVVRRCTISEVKYGIFNDREPSRGWYIADNALTGIDARWVPREQENAAETGVVVYGRGHVVEYNEISRFWDCLTIAGAPGRWGRGHRPPLRGHRLQQQRIAPGPRRLARDGFWQP
jgi:hypothetical protein